MNANRLMTANQHQCEEARDIPQSTLLHIGVRTNKIRCQQTNVCVVYNEAAYTV